MLGSDSARSSSTRGSPERGSSYNPFASFTTPSGKGSEDDEDDNPEEGEAEDELSARLERNTASPTETLTDCTVAGSKYVSEGAMSGHVKYLVCFRFIDQATFCVWKRYSDFLKLYKTLTESKTQHAATVSEVDFPRKRVTSNKKDSVKDDRCTKFDGFMKVVVGLAPRPQPLEAWISEAQPMTTEESVLLSNVPMPTSPFSPSTSTGGKIDRGASVSSPLEDSEGFGSGGAEGVAAAQEQHPPSPPKGPVRKGSLPLSESPVSDFDDRNFEDGRAAKKRSGSYSSMLRVAGRNIGGGGGNSADPSSSPLGSGGLSGDTQSGGGVVGRMINPTLSRRFSESELKREVAAAEKRAREEASREATIRLEQRQHQMREEFVAKEIRLQTEVDGSREEARRCQDAMRRNQAEWDSERRELLSSLALERQALISFSAYWQYWKAMSCLRVRITTWEKDGRDKHIRYLLEVKSSFPESPHEHHQGSGVSVRPSSSSAKRPHGRGGRSFGDRAERDGDLGGSSSDTEEETDLNYDTDEDFGGDVEAGGGRGDGGGGANEGREKVSKRRTNGPAADALVRHRYSDFLRLARTLQCQKALPPKSYFSLGRRAIAERAEALERFVNETVLPTYILDAFLLEFLGMPPPPVVPMNHVLIGLEHARGIKDLGALVDAVSIRNSARAKPSAHAPYKSNDALADATAAASPRSNPAFVEERRETPNEDDDQLGELRLGSDFVDSEAYDGDSYDARLSTMTAVLDS